MKDSLNKKEIINLLPHREPMLLIDELINIKKLSSATGIVNVKKNSFFVQGHFPGQPVMPGVLIIEAFAQATALLGAYGFNEVRDSDNEIYYLLGVDKARFRKPAGPGDQIIIEVKFITVKRGIWKFDAHAFVDSDEVASAELLTTIME